MDPISTYPSSSSPDNGASARHGISDRVRETFDGVSHKVSDAAGRVQERASHAADSSRQMVKDHPLRTLGMTLGAGVIIGLILSRALR